MIQALIPAVTALIGKVVDRAIPDKGKADELKAELTMQLLSLSSEELKSATSIIVAEAQGGSWLQRNWRPLLMLTFAGLIVSRWLGLSVADIPPELELKLFEIIQVGLGGYVIGRSAEKVVKEWRK